MAAYPLHIDATATIDYGQLTPTSTRAHHRESSLSSLGSAGPASPYTTEISNMQVAGDIYHDFQDYHQSSAKPLTPIHTPLQENFLAPNYTNFYHNSNLAYTMGQDGLPRQMGDVELMPAPEFHSHSGRPSIASVASHKSPSTLPSYDEERQKSDIYTDELYNPNFQIASTPASNPTATAPLSLQQNDVFSQRLQAANSQYSSTQTPLAIPSGERSPFRQGSPLAPANDAFSGQSPNVHFGTATHMRKQQKAENDARALQQQMERASPGHVTPRTISPKDVDLLYDESEEDARTPLFPPQNQQRQSLSYQQTASFGNMAASRRWSSSKFSDTETYTCTYHGCTLRFDTPAKLQRHKREGHREQRENHQKHFKSGILVEQRGLKVLINNLKDSAFGDTGAGQNVISDRRREELGLEIRPQPTYFPMGNSKKIYSPGTVELSLAFEDDPKNVMTIVAHVVHSFAYDLLLGNPFLQATQCLTKFMHRFTTCLFSLVSKWSLNLLGETTHRFKGTLGKGVNVLGLPDIGSVRNVMDAKWALDMAQAGGFEILSQPENCGWIVFPDGTEEATVGQVNTSMTLDDGKVVPLVFELLPHCHLPVIFGQQFVFDYNIYSSYSTSIIEFKSPDSGDELMPLGWRMNKGESKKKRSGATGSFPQGTQKDDQDRQLKWNLTYQHGRTASTEEWNQENTRREEHERQLNPHWQPNNIPLIAYKPREAYLQHTSVAPAVRNSDSSSSSPSENPRLVDSPGSSLDLTQDQNDVLINPWNNFLLGDSFGIHEAAQWGES
ncbi:hypothetical protein G7Y89_g2060 [Cudoniella acicularis]|uniref:C2H2-type domain-containing protein n=1 Tax=Cudoniella acicularis TaxID=354080 RepID=A0A8H4RV50_9HELO|nr:hypothetical protein G7Y89_g2060 [Cudoniella acicularis]